MFLFKKNTNREKHAGNKTIKHLTCIDGQVSDILYQLMQNILLDNLTS